MAPYAGGGGGGGGVAPYVGGGGGGGLEGGSVGSLTSAVVAPRRPHAGRLRDGRGRAGGADPDSATIVDADAHCSSRGGPAYPQTQRTEWSVPLASQILGDALIMGITRDG